MTRERKLLELNCYLCQGSGANGRGLRCHECHGRRTVKIANPFYVAPGEYPTWFQLGGGEGWAREIRRIGDAAGLRPNAARIRARFVAIARLLEPWRIRSSVQCNHLAIAAILPMLEACRQDPCRRLAGECRSPWTAAELGELLVAARNRAHLWELGRTEPKPKGPRFDIDRIPLERLEALIQRHPDMAIVERLRDARNRRLQPTGKETT